MLFQNGLWCLSIPVALLSFVWPFVKIGVFLACWCTPACLLKPSHRGLALSALTFVGKLSLLEPFVATLIATILFITKSDSSDEESDYILIGAMTGMGFPVRHLATTLSMAVGDSMLHAHKRSMQATEKNLVAEISSVVDAESLRTEPGHAAPVTKASAFTLARCSTEMKVIMTLLLSANPLFLGVALGLRCLVAKYTGVIGVAKYALGGGQDNAWSILEMINHFQRLIASPWLLHAATFVLLSLLLWFFVLGPLLMALAMLALWFVPLPAEPQAKLRRAVFYLWRWQGLDIFCVVVLAVLPWGDTIFACLAKIINNDSAMSGICMFKAWSAARSCDQFLLRQAPHWLA